MNSWHLFCIVLNLMLRGLESLSKEHLNSKYQKSLNMMGKHICHTGRAKFYVDSFIPD